MGHSLTLIIVINDNYENWASNMDVPYAEFAVAAAADSKLS